MEKWTRMVIVLVCLFVCEITCQIISDGKCASFESKNKFSSAKYFSGRWYVMEGYRNKGMKMAACHSFSFQYDTKYLYINESVKDMGNRKTYNYRGKAKFFEKDEPNHFRLVPGIKSLPYGAHLWVIATDYNNYGVIYTCSQLSRKVKKEQIYILSRTRSLSDFMKLDAVRAVAESDFPVRMLVPHYQRQCDDYIDLF